MDRMMLWTKCEIRKLMLWFNKFIHSIFYKGLTCFLINGVLASLQITAYFQNKGEKNIQMNGEVHIWILMKAFLMQFSFPLKVSFFVIYIYFFKPSMMFMPFFPSILLSTLLSIFQHSSFISSFSSFFHHA